MDEQLSKVIHKFKIEGKLKSVVPFKIGHINETYLSSWANAKNGVERRFIHQRINHQVFKNVPALMDNVVRVIQHIRKKRPDERATLTLVYSKNNRSYLQDDKGNYWRSYVFIEESSSAQVCQGNDHAYQAAFISGQFVADLADLDPQQFYSTIPNFISTPYRYKQLDEAVSADCVNRLREVKADLDFVMSQRSGSEVLMKNLDSGALPLRVTHNDLKFNNVLFDKASGKALCVVDLDTCMPGTPVYDFGDLCRSASVSAAEDEVDLDRVHIDLPIFSALVKGYLEGSGNVLTRDERALLWFAPGLIALTLGVRFLTDFIQGDTYFKVHHHNHNLDRARTQFQIVRNMQSQEGAMRRIIEECAGG